MTATPLDLVEFYRLLRRYGLNDSHSGNASVRCTGGFLVTPTGCCADTLDSSDLVMVPLDGEVPARASQDAALHRGIYQRLPQAQAVLHSHGPHSLAMTFDGSEFRPPDFEGQYYFRRVPVLDIPYAENFEQARQRVPEALESAPITVVRGHGVYAWGESLDQAYRWTCSLESSAQLAFLARQAGTLPGS